MHRSTSLPTLPPKFVAHGTVRSGSLVRGAVAHWGEIGLCDRGSATAGLTCNGSESTWFVSSVVKRAGWDKVQRVERRMCDAEKARKIWQGLCRLTKVLASVVLLPTDCSTSGLTLSGSDCACEVSLTTDPVSRRGGALTTLVTSATFASMGFDRPATHSRHVSMFSLARSF